MAEKEAKEKTAKIALADAVAKFDADAKTQNALLQDQLDETNRTLANLKAIREALTPAADIISRHGGLSGLSGEELKKLQSSIKSAVTTAEIGVTAAGQSDETAGKAAVVAKDVLTAPQPSLVKVLAGNKPLNAITFASNGRLATAGEDNFVRVWSPAGDQVGSDIRGSYKDGVKCLAFSPDGMRLAIGSNGSAVGIFDFGPHTMRDYGGHKDVITSVAFSPDGATVASSSADKSVQIWDAGSLQIPRNPPKLLSIPTSVAFNAAGVQVVASLDDPSSAAFVWTLPEVTNDAKPVILKAKCEVNGARFNKDGTLIVGAEPPDNKAVIWDAVTGKEKAALPHGARVSKAIFNPAGDRVATAGADGMVKLWNVADGALIRTLTGHKGAVRDLAFSPDGKILLTGGADATAKLWYDGEIEARYTLTGHTGYLTAVAFNADGSQFATAGLDGTARLWNLKELSQPPPEAATGWCLYGWLDPNVEQPTLRAQSFAPAASVSRTDIPKKGSVVTAEAFMNIRDSITPGPDKKWQQGHPVGVLLKGESVKVLEVLADPKARPPAVWIQFKKM